jgi:hypothetical protein
MQRFANTVSIVLAGALTLAGTSASAATIEGKLAYPSEEIPPLVIVAQNQTTRARIVIETPARAKRYRIEVPAGRYFVYAIPAEPGLGTQRGAYSAYTVCGQRTPKLMQAGKCTEHRVLAVDVAERDSRTDIDLDDWYLPEDEIYKLPAPRER